MNLALTDEQVFLREAARGSLARTPTLAAARAALDGDELPDLWPTACEAGWPGLLIGEERGGAGLDVFDATLVLGECGRVLAGVPLLGHLPASCLLYAGGAEELPALASGQQRGAYLPALPPDDLREEWTGDSPRGHGRVAPLRVTRDGAQGQVDGLVSWVPDAPGADILAGVAVDEEGTPVAVSVSTEQAGVSVEPVDAYDATRQLGHVMLTGASARVLDISETELATSWHVGQALLAAESIGAAERALEASVAYARERHTFGRPIGSYQAVKHALTEVLRLLENGRSLLYYAGWARQGAPSEFPLAANAARSTAGRALDYAAREMIAVHGGIGATWEHDAPLFFRRAQLSRRLLGGAGAASDRVAAELLVRADAAERDRGDAGAGDLRAASTQPAAARADA